MVFWTRSRIIAAVVIGAIALVGIVRLPHLRAAEKSEQAPGPKQETPGKDAETAGEPERIDVDALRFVAGGRPVTHKTSEAAGFVLVADGAGPQVAVLVHAGAFVACVRRGETAES